MACLSSEWQLSINLDLVNPVKFHLHWVCLTNAMVWDQPSHSWTKVAKSLFQAFSYGVAQKMVHENTCRGEADYPNQLKPGRGYQTNANINKNICSICLFAYSYVLFMWSLASVNLWLSHHSVYLPTLTPAGGNFDLTPAHACGSISHAWLKNVRCCCLAWHNFQKYVNSGPCKQRTPCVKWINDKSFLAICDIWSERHWERARVYTCPKTGTGTSDVFGRLRTSSGIFGNDRVVFKNPSTPRIKISRVYLEKSWAGIHVHLYIWTHSWSQSISV